MFTALVLICLDGAMKPDDCYYLAGPELYESYETCMLDTYSMISESQDLIEIPFNNNSSWKITKVRCINWKQVEV